MSGRTRQDAVDNIVTGMMGAWAYDGFDDNLDRIEHLGDGSEAILAAIRQDG